MTPTLPTLHPLAADLHAIQTGTGVAPLRDRALLRISGADSTRWLNGMVTNSVSALAPGQGAYTFLLNAQGRIQGDGTVYREPAVDLTDPPGAASFLFSSTATQLSTLVPLLDRFIIMDDVELTRLSPDDATLLLLGPTAEATLRSLALPLPGPLRLLHAETPDGPVLLSTPASGPDDQNPLPRVELRASAALIATLLRQILAAGVVEVSPAALEAWRIREGTPLFGADIRDRDLAQETAQTHALHFAKGCYLGQEIVERIRSRGQVHRLLTRLTLLGALPESLPAPLLLEGKPAGEITSAAELPAIPGAPLLGVSLLPPRLVALGYVRRESLAGTLSYPGGTAKATTVTP